MPDVIDKALGIGASFDWISPLASVVGDMLNGGGHGFLIPYDASPMSGREISWMLSDNGIKSWGHMVVSGTLMVKVRKEDAQRAYALLQQHGVPVENPPPAQKPRSRKAARNAGGPFSVFDDVFGSGRKG